MYMPSPARAPGPRGAEGRRGAGGGAFFWRVGTPPGRQCHDLEARELEVEERIRAYNFNAVRDASVRSGALSGIDFLTLSVPGML